jgi:hypothetical protein
MRIGIAMTDTSAPAAEFFTLIFRSHGTKYSAPRQDVLTSATALAEELERQSTLLPYSYSIETRAVSADGPVVRGAGGMSGFRIGGQIHSLKAGAGRCLLERWERDSAGGGRVVERIDVRDRKSVNTDAEWQTIRIKRRKLQIGLPLHLPALIAFLQSRTEPDVTVLWQEREPTLPELLRQLREGGGQADGAGEELFRRGDAARRELIQLLTNGRQKALHPQIVWALLTILPSSNARRAVEDHVERVKDTARKKEILGLLAATGAPQ